MSSPAAPPRARRRPGVARLALAAATVLVLGVVAWVVALTARGGHLFLVQTPSMGRTAPVGTLVVSEPVGSAPLRVGEVVSFRPPGISRVYTHRIIKVTAKGLRTKGDLNSAPDGWVVPTSRVVGRAAHLWSRLGWLVQMLPWLMGGLVLTAVVARLVRPVTRSAVWIAGSSLALSLALVVVRPLVRAETVGFVPVGTTGVRMSVVATGLLPVRATSLDGHWTDVVPGQLGWVETHKTDSHGRFELLPKMHLPWWGWVLVVLFCLLPLLAALLVRDRTTGTGDGDRPDGTGSAAGSAAAVVATPTTPEAGSTALARVRGVLGRRARAAAVVASCLALAVGLTPTQAALTATIANSTNTVATRTFFTCLDAMQYFKTSSGHPGQLYTGFAMGNGTGVVGTTDQGSNGYTGKPANLTQVSAQGGCVSDWTKRQQGYVTFNGTSSQWNLPTGSSISNVTSNPGNANRLTWNTWIRTTTTKGGVISCPAGTDSSCADRVTWMNNSGKLCFGVSSTTICSPNAYNDGSWHMVTTQIDPKLGMTMWVDAVQVASNSSVTGGDAIISYPQWGYASATLKSAFNSNGNAPTSLYFAGDMMMAAMIGGNSSSVQIGQSEITALYQSAMP